MDWVVYAVVAHILLSLYLFRLTVLGLNSALEALDEKLATAIQSVLQAGLNSDQEPINPIQLAIAEMLSNRMRQVPVTAQVTDLPRDDSGKFQ